jgi:hypothetical protein
MSASASRADPLSDPNSARNPSAAGSLDQAPVTVYITTGNVSNVFVVQVGALLAQPSGGYAVEVVGAGNTGIWCR